MTTPIVQRQVIGNPNSKVDHVPGCSSLPDPDNQIAFKSREEVEMKGYRPHETCAGN